MKNAVNTENKTSGQNNFDKQGEVETLATPTPTPYAASGTPSTPASAGTGNSQAAGTVIQQVKSTATDAYHTAASKATEKVEEQKIQLTGGLTNIADNVRKFGENLTSGAEPAGISKFAAEYTNTAADKIEKAVRYFEGSDLKAMYRDVENAARRNPAMILGGAFALGFLATRFLKSSPPDTFSAGVARETESPQANKARAQAM